MANRANGNVEKPYYCHQYLFLTGKDHLSKKVITFPASFAARLQGHMKQTQPMRYKGKSSGIISGRNNFWSSLVEGKEGR